MTTCTEEGCDKPHFAHGRCIAHHFRVKRGSTRTGPLLPYRGKQARFCTINGCKSKHLANGLCSAHYRRWKAKDWLGGEIKHYGKGMGCSKPNCKGLHAARGLCKAHYNQWYRDTHRGRKGGVVGE